MASNSSFCPFPAIPATPKISPLLAVNEISSTTAIPSSLRHIKSFTQILSTGFTGSVLSIFKLTFSPTIISVNDSTVASFVLTVPTYSPFLKTETRSDNSNTSFNLWVIIIIDFPAALIFLSTWKSFSVSCGVKTAVGSSKIKILAPL